MVASVPTQLPDFRTGWSLAMGCNSWGQHQKHGSVFDVRAELKQLLDAIMNSIPPWVFRWMKTLEESCQV